MTGAALRAIDPLDRRPAARRGPERPAEGSTTTSSTWQVGFTFADAAGHAGPAGQQPAGAVRRCSGSGPSCSRSSTRRPTRWPGSSWRSTPTTSSSRRPRGCGPPPPSGSRPSRPSTRKAGSRSTATSTPSASSPTPSPRRPSSRPPTTSRSSRWRRPRGRCWPTTTSRWPKARARARPTSRPATSRPRTSSCRSRTTARITRGRSTARPIPTRSSRCRRPDLGPEGPRPLLPAPVGPLGPPPTPLPPQVPAGEPDILSRAAARARRAGGGPRLGARSEPPRPGPPQDLPPLPDPDRPARPCRRSDRDRTPDATRPLPGRPFLRRGRPVSVPGQGDRLPMNPRRPQPRGRPGSVLSRVKTLLTLGSVVRPE